MYSQENFMLSTEIHQLASMISIEVVILKNSSDRGCPSYDEQENAKVFTQKPFRSSSKCPICEKFLKNLILSYNEKLLFVNEIKKSTS